MKESSETRNTRNLITKAAYMAIDLIATMVITSLVVSRIGSIANGYTQMAVDFISYITVLSLALNSMASRFITMSYYKKDQNELNRYYNSVLFGDLMLAGALSLPLIILTLNLNHVISIPDEMVTDVKILFAVMFANFIVNLSFMPYSVATFVKNRIDLDSLRNIEGTIIKLLVTALLFKLSEPRIWYVSVGTLAGTVYYALLNIYYTHKLVPEVKLFRKEFYKWAYIKQLLLSGIWNSVTRIGAIFMNGFDLLIANQLISNAAMGVLSISKTLPKYLCSGMVSFASVFTPGVMIKYAKKDKDGMLRVIDFAIKINSIISIVIEVGVIVFSARFYLLWFPGQDAYLLQKLSTVAIMGYVVLMPFEVLWTVFTATNKVKISSLYIFSEAVITVSIVMVSMLFVHNETVRLFVIAGTSSVMEMIRGFVFLPIVSAGILEIPKTTFYKPLLRVICTFTAALLLSQCLNGLVRENSWLILISLAAASGICTMAAGYIILLNRNDRAELVSRIKSIIKHK